MNEQLIVPEHNVDARVECHHMLNPLQPGTVEDRAQAAFLEPLDGIAPSENPDLAEWRRYDSGVSTDRLELAAARWYRFRLTKRAEPLRPQPFVDGCEQCRLDLIDRRHGHFARLGRP